MAVVQRFHHLVHQCLQVIVGDVLPLVEFLETGQELVVLGIPVQTVLHLVVPQGIVLVHAVPEHLVLSSKTLRCRLKGHHIIVVVRNQCVAVLSA